MINCRELCSSINELRQKKGQMMPLFNWEVYVRRAKETTSSATLEYSQ